MVRQKPITRESLREMVDHHEWCIRRLEQDLIWVNSQNNINKHVEYHREAISGYVQRIEAMGVEGPTLARWG